jgi:hypothetical protein
MPGIGATLLTSGIDRRCPEAVIRQERRLLSNDIRN